MLHALLSSSRMRPDILTIRFQNNSILISAAIPHIEFQLMVGIRREMAVWAFLADFSERIRLHASSLIRIL
jgi:hypothetical protein